MRKRSKSLPITIPGKDEELRKERIETRRTRAIFSAPYIIMPAKPLLQALFEMSDSDDEETSSENSETSTDTSTDTTDSVNDSQETGNIFEMEIKDIEDKNK